MTLTFNIADLFEKVADTVGDREAIICGDSRATYSDLEKGANQMAHYLASQGVGAGDHIGLYMHNCAEYLEAMLACFKIRAVPINVNYRYVNEELLYIFKNADMVACIHHREFIPHIAAVRDAATELQTFVSVEDGSDEDLAAIDAVDYTVAKQTQSDKRDFPLRSDDDLFILYTGGTTGVAKGAMLTHANLVANILQCMAIFDTYQFEPQSEILVVPLPLYHIYSFTNCMVILATGNHCVLNPNPRDTASLIKDMRRYPMTAFCGINTLFVSLCNHPDFHKVDFSKLRLTLSGGMALTADAAKQWTEATGCDVYQGYGLTEASPVLTVNPGNGNQLGTIGLPLPSTQIKLVDAEGNEVAAGEVGELCVKGPQVMSGYWQLPEATAEMIDSEGWLHTGDIAEIQSNGYLKIVDRKKDMIIVSGFNVFPNELEDVLSEHPSVVECAAIGVPDDVSGETITMYVVVSEPVAEQDLKAFCKQRLTAYKVPKRFEFRDDLPKSAVGKILRRELR